MTSEFDPKNVLPLIQEVISAAFELKEDSLQNEEHRVRTLEATMRLMLAVGEAEGCLDQASLIGTITAASSLQVC